MRGTLLLLRATLLVPYKIKRRRSIEEARAIGGGGGPCDGDVRLIHLAFPIHCFVYGIGVVVL
jgi:hypothetical protein